MKPFLLYSQPYYNTRKDANPRSGQTYENCQLAKKNPWKIRKSFLQRYTDALPNKCILIPVPGHDGTAGSTLDLCKCLRKHSREDADILIKDILRCDPHESLCDAKRKGRDTDEIIVRMHLAAGSYSKKDLRDAAKDHRIILVDNVLDTGTTLRAAAEALGLDDLDALTLGYTGNDKGIYNPFRMLDTLQDALDDTYEFDIVDPRDTLDPKNVEECLKAKDLSPLYEKDCWDDATYENAREVAMYTLSASDFDEEDQERFRDDELFRDLVFAVENRNASTPQRDCFLQTVTHGRLEIKSNYDCWVPPYDAGCLYSKDSLLWGLMAQLCLNPKKVKEEVRRVWDVRVEGPWPDIKSRNGKEVVSYKDFVRVLLECPNYGIWTFFGVFNMNALLEDHFDTDNMLIPKGTTCTMYNSWNGGGSCAMATTLRDLPVRELIRRAAPYEDGVSVLVDEYRCGHGYASNEVYSEHPSEDTFLI